jgi:ABC-type antimicrobial peptide transport system permease subunit
MAQVNAKKNFNAISVLANILSWAIVAFSILCIILFIVNLLQSYFQKVKRNLGTFKAFGISNAELISVFVVIMIVLAAASILISLTVVYCVQTVLPMLGFVKEGGFGYLYLWNDMTMGTIAIVVISSVVTVYVVMRRLLSATPGDLIYDR